MEGREYKTQDAGFTLVELLVSLAVMSLMAGLLVQGLGFGARAFEHSEIASQRAQGIKLVQQVLRSQIEGIYPKNKGAERGGPVAFEGDRNELAYWSQLPRAFGEGGYVLTRLFVEGRAGTSDLKIAWCPGQTSFSVRKKNCSEKVLLEDIQGLSFTFHDPETKAPLVRWRDRQSLPALVSVTIRFREGDGRVWPQFAATPRVQKPSDCRFDPVSKRCRG